MINMTAIFKKKNFISLIITQLFLMGCSTHVVVVSEHPPALIKELPYKIGLVLDSSFTNYSFIREKDDEKIRVNAAGALKNLTRHSDVFCDKFIEKEVPESLLNF